MTSWRVRLINVGSAKIATKNRGDVGFVGITYKTISCHSSDKYLQYCNIAIIDTSRRDTSLI